MRNFIYAAKAIFYVKMHVINPQLIIKEKLLLSVIELIF